MDTDGIKEYLLLTAIAAITCAALIIVLILDKITKKG